jgi:nucleotide-binding universal stress UspA family protein
MTDSRPIVVGYDGRAGSDAALDEAARLAGELGASSLVVVFSHEVSRLGGEVADLEAAVEERGRAVLQEAVARVGDRVAVETELRGEPAADGLVSVADERSAQMIVVGSTGEGPLRGILVGSTSYKLLHLSTTPVLVVRAG